MSLGDVDTLVGFVIVVGLVGTVVPVLPGPALIGAAVALWAVLAGQGEAWAVLAVVLTLLVAGQVLKYLTAGRRMTSSGVPRRSLVLAGLAGLVGFFVLPVVGLVVGFVGALYLAERQRVADPVVARRATVTALQAVGIAILVELTSALLAAGTWFAAVAAGAGS